MRQELDNVAAGLNTSQKESSFSFEERKAPMEEGKEVVAVALEQKGEEGSGENKQVTEDAPKNKPGQVGFFFSRVTKCCNTAGLSPSL